MTRIEVVLGDITAQRTDAIVTAANESLMGGGGVDGAIHRAAGPRLAEAGAAVGPCDPGDAKATAAFELDPPVRHVIHTVGPVWDGGGHGEAETLASCYRRCLRVADELGATSVSFPAIATGVYGYPAAEAARIAATTLASTPTTVREIRLVAFDRESLDLLRAAVAAATQDGSVHGAQDHGTPDDGRVTRSMFGGRLQPICSPHAMAPLPRRVWSDEEWDRIQRGYRARDMDQKWNVVVEGEVVHLHRSWTGFGVYAATFAPVAEGGRRIAHALVERDPERYQGTDDAYDCVMLELVLSAIVLGEPASDLRARLVELTRRLRSSAAGAPAALIEHTALGQRSDS